MTRNRIAIACRRSWLALVLLAPAISLGAENHPPAAEAPSILARLPIGFRQVGRGSDPSPAATGAQAPGALPLAPRGTSGANHSTGSPPPTAGRAIATVVSSLAIVVGLLGVVTWLARRFHPTPHSLPPELFQYLGTTRLDGRQTIHVLRFGAKLLLVVAGPAGLQPLAELTDAQDVEHLTTLCQPKSASSITATLQRVVADWSRTSTPPRANARPVRPSASAFAAAPRAGGTSHA